MHRSAFVRTLVALLTAATLMAPSYGSAAPPAQPIVITIPELGWTATISDFVLDTSFESGAFKAKLTVRRVVDGNSAKLWNAYFNRNQPPFDDLTVVNGDVTWTLNDVSILGASMSATENKQGLNVEEFEMGVAGAIQITILTLP